MRLRYILLLCLLSLASVAQSKIEGIGKFKIGKTTIADLSADSIKKVNVSYDAVGAGQDLVELIKNEANPDDTPNHTPYSSALRVFYSDRYEVAGVELIDFYLTFYNGVLYKINANHSEELIEALTIKYGKPKVEHVVKPVKCVYRLTGRPTAPKHNQTKSTSWINGNVTATYYFKLTYNSNCESDYYSFFHVIDTSKMSAVIAIEKAAQAKEAAATAQKKKRTLSEF